MKQLFMFLFAFPLIALYAGNRNLLRGNLSQSSNNNSMPKVASKASVMLTTNARYGLILTDSAGSSLYFFTKDTLGSSCIKYLYAANISISPNRTYD